MTQEEFRLSESTDRKKHWKRWGPYLSERAWGTVREDYSAYGNAWNSFHMIMRVRAFTAGMKMGSRESRTVIRTFASHSRCGTSTTPY